MTALVLSLVVLVCSVAGAFGACDTATLADELQNDPANVGYAPYVASGADKSIVTLLNQVQEGQSYLINKGVVDADTAGGTWGDLIFLVPLNPNADIRAKWLAAVQNLFTPRATIDYSDPLFDIFFAQVVADQLQIPDGLGGTRNIEQADVDARIMRQGSRAEVVCGSGTVIKKKDVSKALRGLE
jgi:hypothetical protein